MQTPTKLSTTEELAEWNDEMVKRHHKDGTLFESKNPLLRYLETQRLKKIIRFAKLKPKNQVLDLGCGEGHLISLMPNDVSIVGIDISKYALNRAKETLKDKKNVELKFANAYQTNLPSNYFDKIICSEVIEHVPEPRKIIREVHRLVKDNGLVVVSVPDEKRIQTIMNVINFLKINKFLHAARDQKEYDWHLQFSNKKFLKEIINGFFKIKKLRRVPSLIGYRFVAALEKINEKNY